MRGIAIVFLLLFFIIFLIAENLPKGAVIAGLVLIIFVTISLKQWRAALSSNLELPNRIRINLNDRFWLERNISFYKTLSKSDKVVFEDRIGLFLAQKKIAQFGVLGSSEKEICFRVASSAIYAFWNLPNWNFGNLATVLIYPENLTKDKEVGQRVAIEEYCQEVGFYNSIVVLSVHAIDDRLYEFENERNDNCDFIAYIIDRTESGQLNIRSYSERHCWYGLLDKEIQTYKLEKTFDFSQISCVNEDLFVLVNEYFLESSNKIEMLNHKLFDYLSINFNRSGK